MDIPTICKTMLLGESRAKRRHQENHFPATQPPTKRLKIPRRLVLKGLGALLPLLPLLPISSFSTISKRQGPTASKAPRTPIIWIGHR
jgi:hypothetical protein